MEWLIAKLLFNGDHVMKSQTLINILGIALFVAVLGAFVIALWMSIPIPILLATVSWNG
jgi:hypothetical protein